MTIQTLFDAWKASGAFAVIEAPATEAEIQAAEEKIGAQLPELLREVYRLFNGRWAWQLEFFPLNIPPEHSSVALANANEQFIEYGWHIPKEIRLFAGDGGGGLFGIWLPACGNPIYNHPIIEVGELFEEGCMGVAGTNLLSFLHGWSAFRMMMQYIILEAVDKSKELEFLDKLQVPRWLRYEHFDESQYDDGQAVVDHHFSQIRKWADPLLPDPYGDSYSQRYTITDLKRLFGESG